MVKLPIFGALVAALQLKCTSQTVPGVGVVGCAPRVPESVAMGPKPSEIVKLMAAFSGDAFTVFDSFAHPAPPPSLPPPPHPSP